MLKFTAAFLLLFCFNASFGQHYNEKYGKPVVVLIEENPWLMVIGSDVPTFALYENGQIIYSKVIDNHVKFFEVKNVKEKNQPIINSIGITDSLLKQRNYIKTSDWTDQPTCVLILNLDTLKEISVYGNLRNLKGESRSKTPKAFLTVYDNLINYDDKAANEWMPDSIEVMATKYSYSPEKPLKWPAEWGDLKSPTSVKRGDDLYSIYIDRKYFTAFISLLKRLREKQAVEINGEKYSLSYRLPFPNIK